MGSSSQREPHVPHAAPAPGKVHPTAQQLQVLERKESALWRLTILFLVLLGIAFGGHFWESVEGAGSFASRTLRLPGTSGAAAGIVVLVVLFAAYVWSKKREIAELRGVIRGMQSQAEGPPTEQQMERLLEVVARSQQGYRDLIDSFDDLVFTFGLDGEIRAANRSLSEILERPFSEIVGRKLDEFVDEPVRASAEKALPRFLEKRHWQGVVRVRLKNGGVRYLDCILQAVVKQGDVTGVSCLARDVTQQRESEQRFKELFETLQEGVYFTTPEGKILDANPTLVRMLGYTSQEELLEMNVRDLYVDPRARSEFLDLLERQGTVRNEEILLRRKDGSTMVCLDTSSTIRDSSGRVVRYQGALVDITERRRIEEKLHAEQEFARRLMDSFPDLIVVIDTQFRYSFVSPNISALLGFTPEELIGRTVGERSHADDRAGMLEMARSIFAGEKSFASLEYRTQHKDGSWRIFRATASPLYGPPPHPTAENPHPAPAITGLIASSRDFTEFKRLEQQVIQSEKLAAMGQLIAGVAHELNNPLTAIVGISDLLRDRSSRAPDPSSSRQFDLLNQQARRAADIVQNLLSFSRPAAAHKSLVHLPDLARRTLQLHEYSLRVNNIVVDFQPAPSLPPVLADTNQIMQVFLNLIVNAEQAIRGARDRGSLAVRFGTAPLGAPGGLPSTEAVSVVFQDDGPGIPAEVLPKIFDPFFTTKRPGRGTGLGLSICMALIREHGGTIEAQEAPGGGALFRVLLPRAPKGATAAVRDSGAAVLAANSGNGPPRRPSPAAAELARKRVLVVDDEESIRELVENGLAARGMQVDCAASGEEALHCASENAYDVVLCDVKMPGLSGDQVYQKLKELTQVNGMQPIPFLFMTGDVMDAQTPEQAAMPGVRWVQKPFRVSDLVPILTEVLSEAKQQTGK
jgi:two-component system NtrC family sensor kinase